MLAIHIDVATIMATMPIIYKMPFISGLIISPMLVRFTINKFHYPEHYAPGIVIWRLEPAHI